MISCRYEPIRFVNYQDCPLFDFNINRKTLVNECIFPQGLYVFDKYLVCVNINRGVDYPFYVYDIESLAFKYIAGNFGRGKGEFYDINPYYFEKTDSTVWINSNDYFLTEVYFGDTFEIKKTIPLINLTISNLLKINDSVYLCDNRGVSEYIMFDIDNKHSKIKFGDYPDSPMEFQEVQDKFNFYQKSIVINRNEGLMASFYRNLPLIRFYDLDGKLIENIKLEGINQYKGSIEDYYAGRMKVFYSNPVATEAGIYVLYVNKNEAEFSKNQLLELQKWGWNGELLKRYVITEPFSLYTIAEDSVFYGINVQENNSYFFKGNL